MTSPDMDPSLPSGPGREGRKEGGMEGGEKEEVGGKKGRLVEGEGL